MRLSRRHGFKVHRRHKELRSYFSESSHGALICPGTHALSIPLIYSYEEARHASR